MGLKNLLLLCDLDKTLAIVGIILSLILIVSLGMEISRGLYLLIAILTLISCLLWLAMRKSHTFDFHRSESWILTVFCATCFFALYSMSVLSLYLRPELYERPLIYFILTSLMAGIIACEIFKSGRQHAPLILIQILLLGVSISWSQLMIFPSLIGIDPWYHFDLTNQIISQGIIPENSGYSKLPLFHLMIATTSLITSFPYKFATMLSVSLGQILCNALFIYLIANYSFKSHQIGLLAALLVIIANYHIRMSYWSIPNAFAAVYIPIVIYQILQMTTFKSHKFHNYSTYIIIFIMFVAIILTHSIAAMCMAILLFIAWGSLVSYHIIYSRTVNYISLLIPFSFSIMMFAWWTYSSGHIQTLGQLIKWGFSIDYFDNTPAEFLKYFTPIPLEEIIFNNFAQYLFFAISFIGIFYMISQKGNNSTFFTASVGLAPLAIMFLSFISGTSIIGERWAYLAQIFLSIPLAVSTYLIVTWKSKKTFMICSFVFGFVVFLSFFMIMSTPANVDNHIYCQVTGSTYAYTQSEMIASDFFAINSVGTLSSDRNYCTNPSSSIYRYIYGINQERLHSLDKSLISSRFEHDGSIKIIRSKLLREPLIRGGHPIYLRSDMNSYISNNGFNRIYENSAVTGYIG